jgi:hypothetical protein
LSSSLRQITSSLSLLFHSLIHLQFKTFLFSMLSLILSLCLLQSSHSVHFAPFFLTYLS